MHLSTRLVHRALSLFIGFVILSSCSPKIAKIFPNRPTKEFVQARKDGSPEFDQGWRDGCEVGMSAGSNRFYKMFYRNNMADGYKMTSSPKYKTAWGYAFWYCYRYDYVKQKSTLWGSMLGGYK